MSHPSTPSFWIKSLKYDLIWFLCGLWLLMGLIGLDHLISPEVSLITIIAIRFVIWIAHRFGVAFVLYGTQEFRPLVRAHPGSLIWGPIVFLFFFWILSALQYGLFGLPSTDTIIILLGVLFFSGPIHMGYQHYGVLAIYRKLAGQSYSPRRSQIEKFLVVFNLSFLIPILTFSLFAHFDWKWTAPQRLYQMLDFLVPPLTQLMMPVLIIYTLSLALFLFFELKEKNPSWPKVLYVLSTFFLACGIALGSLIAFKAYLLQHFIVATGLTYHMMTNSKTILSFDVPKFKRALLPALLIFSMSFLLLLYIGDYRATNRYVKIFPFIETWKTQIEIFIVLITGTGFATEFLHYYWERKVFKLSEPEVAKITWPLLAPKN